MKIVLLLILSSCCALAQPPSPVARVQARPEIRAACQQVEAHRQAILDEWRHLALTSAPSGHEDERAALILEFLRQHGHPEAYRDSAGNVISAKISPGAKAVVFEAHMDTVVQPSVKVAITEGHNQHGPTWTGPGVGDDTAGVVGLLAVVQVLGEVKYQARVPLVFVFSTNEEGGGASEGIGRFIEDHKNDIADFITVDGSPIDPLGAIADSGVGSYGLRVVFRGPGVHTIESFGTPSATHALALAIERLYQLQAKIPRQPVEQMSWLNIGVIKAGTVPNAMAREASFVLDLRSNDAKVGRNLQQQAIDIIRKAANEVGVSVENTPRTRDPIHLDTPQEKQLGEVLRASYRAVGVEPVQGKIGSSDFVIALQRGIPAAGIGITNITHMHSPEEEAEVNPLFSGIKQVLLAAAALTSEP